MSQSNDFGAAIMARVLASTDPNVKMQQQAIEGFVLQQRNEATASQAAHIELVADKLMALPDTAPPSVKSAYEKLLVKLSN